MPKQDVITQAELAALTDEEAELRKAEEALQVRFAAIKARIRAGATVQPGPYRVVQRWVMDLDRGFAILDRTYKLRYGEEILELGTRKAKAKRKKGA